MRSILSPFSCVVAVVAALGVASEAGAQTVPHKESTDGQLINVVDPDPVTGLGGRMDFIGEGKGTHLGKYSQIGGHDFDAFGNIFGEFESTAADGSRISGFYFGTFSEIGEDLFRFDVIAVWEVGTGRLEGVTGSGDVVAILDGESGILHYDTDATWTFP